MAGEGGAVEWVGVDDLHLHRARQHGFEHAGNLSLSGAAEGLRILALFDSFR